MIRTGKDTGLGRFPSRDYQASKAWLDASMTACIPARQPGRHHAHPPKTHHQNR